MILRNASVFGWLQCYYLASLKSTSKTWLPCTPTHHLLSSVLSQATPPNPLSYSAGALPGIDTQGSYNSVARYSIYFKFPFRQPLDNLYTCIANHSFEVSFVL